MKTRSFPYLLAAGLTAMLATPSPALEAPADDAPPPRPAKLPEFKLSDKKAGDEKAEQAREDAAFLGIISADVPEILSSHLALKAGEGIVVRSVVPGGPAEKAGIAVHDVITRVGGEAVDSPEDISNKIAARKPGESVKVDLIHQGKPATLEAKLGNRPAGLAAAESQPMDQLDLEALPKELADRVRDAIAGNIGGMDLQAGGGIQMPPQMEEAMREIQQRMRGAIGEGIIIPDNDAGGKVRLEGQATIRMMDNEGSVEVQSKDGSKEVTVRDKNDNVTWSGPWDTPQDKAAAPEDVRERVESLNIDESFTGKGLRLQMRGAPEE